MSMSFSSGYYTNTILFIFKSDFSFVKHFFKQNCLDATKYVKGINVKITQKLQNISNIFYPLKFMLLIRFSKYIEIQIFLVHIWTGKITVTKISTA